MKHNRCVQLLYHKQLNKQEVVMAKTPEGEIKDQVRKVLDEAGAYYFFPAANGYGRSGVPDIIACYYGHFIGIECKAGSKQPTALQQRELENISKAGGTGILINADNIGKLKDILFIGESND